MNNDEVLGHLLKIESEAAVLVDDAQAEADRRILEAKKQDHAAYEEHYRRESERLENEFQTGKKEAQRQYQAELDAYIAKIASFETDTDRFSALLNRFVTEES